MKKVMITLMMASLFVLTGCQENVHELKVESNIPNQLQPLVREIKTEMAQDLGTSDSVDLQEAKRLTKEMESIARDLNQMAVTTAQEKAILVSKNAAQTASDLKSKIERMKQGGNTSNLGSYLVSIKHKIERIEGYQKRGVEERKAESIETIEHAKAEVQHAKEMIIQWKESSAKADLNIPQLEVALNNGLKHAEEEIKFKETLLNTFESDLEGIRVEVETAYLEAKKIIEEEK